MRLGTVRSPTPISRRLSSISLQKWSNSACDSVRAALRPPCRRRSTSHKCSSKQVKTAVNRIRHAQVPVKQRFSRLRHDHAIDGLNGAARGEPGFPEVIERPKHCGFRMRARRVCVLGARACCNPVGARYVNASRDARGRISSANDRYSSQTRLPRALAARHAGALAQPRPPSAWSAPPLPPAPASNSRRATSCRPARSSRFRSAPARTRC